MKKYPLHQSPFYKCSTKRKLADILNIEIKKINYLIKNIESDKAYFMFKDKNDRKITSPNHELKRVQKRINALISRINVPDWIHGGVKKRSIQTNVTTHKNSNVFVKLDIKGFFENCSREHVYRFFNRKLKMSPDTAKILTDLTTYQNSLVTGSPTSTYLSFLVYEDMFMQVYNIMKKRNMLMSLYIDDITISGNKRIKDLDSFLMEINNTLKKYGHRLNVSKSFYGTVTDYPVITGVVVSPGGNLKVPNKQRQKIINLLELLNSKSKQDDNLKNKIKGSIVTAQQTESNIFLNTLNKIK